MNEFLQQRISNLMGPDPMPASPMMMAEGGEVFEIDDPVTMEEASMAQEAVMADPNADLRGAIEQLMMAERTAEDPFEAKKAQQLAESAMIGSEAPLGPMALELSQAGRGGDTMLAHLTPGEVVLPLGMMDDADFERAVETRFNQLDLNPEEYVAGLGIASLNPVTGLEEFGFFKKVAKGVKKVVKKVVRPVAQIAQFIPGPHQPLAALINKAGTVYDVAKGRASPLALASLATGAGGSFSQNLKDLRNLSTAAGGSGSLLGGIGQAFSQSGTALQSGIGSLFSDPTQTLFGTGPGTVRDLVGGATFSGQAKLPDSEIVNRLRLTAPPDIAMTIDELQSQGMGASEILDAINVSPTSFLNPAGGLDTQANIFKRIGSTISGQPGQQTAFQEFLDDQLGIDPSGGGIFRALQGKDKGDANSGIGGLFGNVGMRDLGAVGLAGILAKLAYDETKDRKGIPLTPSLMMNAAGRFNLENEIARRSGTGAPNPVEFGLLPRGTLPTLSGGRAPTQAQAQLEQRKATGMRYGGPVMAFAEGGNVDMAEFKRMDGDINGPGTEVSDDIPAMLSDGEFVMTGRAVRGAGAFDMKNNNGIITLTPGKGEDRERGTKLMYDMMDLFKEFATEPEAVS